MSKRTRQDEQDTYEPLSPQKEAEKAKAEWDGNPLLEFTQRDPNIAETPWERPTFVRSCFKSFEGHAVLSTLRAGVLTPSKIKSVGEGARSRGISFAEEMIRSGLLAEDKVREVCSVIRGRVQQLRASAKVRLGEPHPSAFPDPEFDPCFLPEFGPRTASSTRKVVLSELQERFHRDGTREIILAAKLEKTSFAEYLRGTAGIEEREVAELCAAIAEKATPTFDPWFLPELTGDVETCEEEGSATGRRTEQIGQGADAATAPRALREEFAEKVTAAQVALDEVARDLQARIEGTVREPLEDRLAEEELIAAVDDALELGIEVIVDGRKATKLFFQDEILTWRLAKGGGRGFMKHAGRTAVVRPGRAPAAAPEPNL